MVIGVALLLIAIATASVFFYTSFVKVGPDQFLHVDWHFLFASKPDLLIATNGWQQGWRARVYRPGYQFIPFVKWFGETELSPLIEIPADHFGLVEALFGESSSNSVIATRVVDCDNFTDGVSFLLNGGQKGPQILAVSQGKWAINKKLFKVTATPLTRIGIIDKELEVALGKRELTSVPQIGIVTIVAGGKEIPEIENRVMAKGVDGHNNFQDLAKFIGEEVRDDDRLEMGIQKGVLEPGKWRLHPIATSVKVSDARFIKQGFVAVIISSFGDDPSNDQIEDSVEQANGNKFAKILKKGTVGKRGIMSEVFGPGFIPLQYYHPIAYRIVEVPTTPIRLCWMTKGRHEKESHNNNDIRIDPVLAVTKEGFSVPVEAELIISATRENAPKIVALAGGLQDLITSIAVPFFDDAARTVVSLRPLFDLLDDRVGVRDEIENKVKEALKPYPINLVKFRISQFDFENSPDKEVAEYVDLRTQTFKAVQQKEVYKARVETEIARIALEETIATADNQKIRIGAEFAKVATRVRGEGIVEAIQLLADRGQFVQIAALLAASDGLSNVANILSKSTKN